jgi:hypothetical protein
MIGPRTYNRMSEVLFALEQAERARVKPTRIQLQKFVYLSDALGQIVGVLRPRSGHKTYRNGPYDAAIQNAVDCLAFRGFARIAGLWRTPSGRLGTSYSIADAGILLLNKIRSSNLFNEHAYVSNAVGDELLRVGWDQVINLVYAEPTYVAARPTGWGSELKSEDGLRVSTAFVLSVIQRASAELNEGKVPDRDWVVDRFFAFLRDYHENYGLEHS